MRVFRFAVLILLSVLFFAGCGPASPEATPSPTLVLSPSPEATPTDTSTATPPPPVGIVVIPPGADPALSENLEPALQERIQEEGLRYQVREALREEDFQRDQIELVVVLSPYPDLENLVSLGNTTNFLAVGFPEAEVGERVSVIRPGVNELDVQGFAAGYMAAMITPDWRVAAIGLKENPAAQQARVAFVAGAKYYCGLCLPKYAPTGQNYLYPKYVEYAPEMSQAERLAAAKILVDRAVETIYVIPGAGTPDIYDYLSSAEVSIIGSAEDFRPDYQDHWVASFSFDLAGAVVAYWPDFRSGQTGQVIEPALDISDVNQELLSPGRLQEVLEIIPEVRAGWITPGQQ